MITKAFAHSIENVPARYFIYSYHKDLIKNMPMDGAIGYLIDHIIATERCITLLSDPKELDYAGELLKAFRCLLAQIKFGVIKFSK